MIVHRRRIIGCHPNHLAAFAAGFATSFIKAAGFIMGSQRQQVSPRTLNQRLRNASMLRHGLLSSHLRGRFRRVATAVSFAMGSAAAECVAVDFAAAADFAPGFAFRCRLRCGLRGGGRLRYGVHGERMESAS